jgi:hypothetical protein
VRWVVGRIDAAERLESDAAGRDADREHHPSHATSIAPDSSYVQENALGQEYVLQFEAVRDCE